MEEHLKKMQEEMQNDQAVLYDVREESEWEEGHLEEAQHLPLSELREENLFEKVDKEKKIYLHCRSGNRVLEAEDILLRNNFENVIALEEGFDYLVDEGFAVAE